MYLLAKLISRQRQGWSSDKLLVDNNLLASYGIDCIHSATPTMCSHDVDHAVSGSLLMSQYQITSVICLWNNCYINNIIMLYVRQLSLTHAQYKHTHYTYTTCAMHTNTQTHVLHTTQAVHTCTHTLTHTLQEDIIRTGQFNDAVIIIVIDHLMK